MSSNHSHTKRPVQLSVVSSIKAVSYSELIQEPQADQSLYKRTAKKFTILLPIFTAAVQAQLLILNSWTYFNHQTSNSKDWTQVAKPESAHSSSQPASSCTSTKAIWARTWSLAAMTSSVPTCAWSQQRASTIFSYHSYSYLPFATMGSGSLQAMTIFESKYKDDMTK